MSAGASENAPSPGADGAEIKPYDANPYFWQYRGRPVVLIGGSKDDNLFQIPDLEAHLDLLASLGGNYVRNTMSSRDEGNAQPFERLPDGRYDLEAWNAEYWNRFERLLTLARERDVIIQIEIWAFHDFYGFWDLSPWNPKNNVNYTAPASGLPTGDPGNYRETKHAFFLTVPAINDNETVRAYQERFVDKLLSISLPYENVLYCMTNEIFTQYSPDWGWYWAQYVTDRGVEADATVQVAEMYQNSDLTHQQHRATLDYPEIYDFVDISQNSGNEDQEHWDNLQWVRSYIADQPRPINHTKTYGGDAVDWTDGDAHGVERFWRSLIGGAAAVRFHRPPSGLGLGDKARAHVRSARMLADEFDFFDAVPDADHALIGDRQSDEAYLSRTRDEQYAVYFPDGGSVRLDVTGSYDVRWLDPASSTWGSTSSVDVDGELQLDAPAKGGWIALITHR